MGIKEVYGGLVIGSVLMVARLNDVYCLVGEWIIPLLYLIWHVWTYHQISKRTSRFKWPSWTVNFTWYTVPKLVCNSSTRGGQQKLLWTSLTDFRVAIQYSSHNCKISESKEWEFTLTFQAFSLESWSCR